jgi:hypothetical protein
MSLFPDEEPIKTKKCVYCKEDKLVIEYQSHPGYKDKLDIRCTSCIRKRTKIVRDLRKTAPEKPEYCQCCGKENVTLVLDHCPVNNIFRGWICSNCNKGLGMLGDNMNGLKKAIKYLENNR